MQGYVEWIQASEEVHSAILGELLRNGYYLIKAALIWIVFVRVY